MKLDAKYMYGLLPAYYRILDAEQGEPLKAFIEILAREGGLVEDNISQLYENWFIETCEEWVVPYIGDLLGVINIHEIADASFSRRAYVANTLAYRRRKGTAAVIEQLALDVTGWRSKAVELFQNLATTQHLNHIRLHSITTPDLRNMNALDLVDTAFDVLSHTADVGRISKGQGRYNIPNIGIFLWRLQSYRMTAVEARPMDMETGIPEGAFTFSPLGLDMQLFNMPQSETEITQLAQEVNVPGLLRARALHDELEEGRKAIVNNEEPYFRYFHDTYPPVFQLFVNENAVPIPHEEIVICNLSNWHVPPAWKTYKKSVVQLDETSMEVDITLPISAAVDPDLGRIMLVNSETGTNLKADYNYGFSGDIGGGPYNKIDSLDEVTNMIFDWRVGVSKDHSAVQSEIIFPTLQEAVTAWNELGDTGNTGLITIMDNRTYEEQISGLLRIRIPEGKILFIIAAHWPITFTSGIPERESAAFHPEGCRPHFRGDIEIEGTAPIESPNGGGLLINGLLIEGKVTVLEGNLNSLTLQHSTVTPYSGALELNAQSGILALSISRSICGPITVDSEGSQVVIEESVIDFKEGVAISVLSGSLGIQKCTVFGTVEARTLDGENCIFVDPIFIRRRQTGCVRFSYLPLESKTPRRYRCQPEMEIKAQVKEKEEKGRFVPASKGIIIENVLQWLFPDFNSTSFGHHAYAQLGDATPTQILTGADNASEMGVLNYLQQPQRQANLRSVLEEYLPVGLESGIIFTT
ncbi:MAG TPA: hypothetical protein VK957_18100 [Lunatimonas sp.]|nr:hypothetical protein [Lunatimonas sp.]